MSKSFRLRTVTLCVAGALLVPCTVFAQSITPSTGAVDGLNPVPSSVTSSPTTPSSTQPIIDSMEVEDIDVTKVLSMISSQFKVPIAIYDISGKISYLNLAGQTPAQAIDTIVRTAHLSCQRTADGTYIISKGSPDANSVPAVGGITPIFPTTNTGAGFVSPTNGLSSTTPATAGMTADTGNEPKLDAVDKGTDGKKRTFRMTLKNIKPSLMAYWLDPANHSAPPDMAIQDKLNARYMAKAINTINTGPMSTLSTTDGKLDTQGVVPTPNSQTTFDSSSLANPYINSNSEQLQSQTLSDAQFGGGGGGGFNGGGGGRNGNNNNGRGGNGRNGGNNGVFQLPQNVDRIVAVDPQNALLVFGTPQGAAELASTIAFLDRPLRQVEIEAQFVSINVTDARNYGLDFTTAAGNFNASATGLVPTGAGALNFGFIRGNFQAAVAALQSNGRTKVLTAPRVLAINNLTASIQQSIYFPIVLNTSTTVVGNAAATNASQNYTYIQTQISLDVTPTINNDGTITVLMQPQFTDTSTPTSTQAAALGLPQVTQQALQTIANVRDGETIALGGLRRKNVSISKQKVPLLSDIPLFGKLFQRRDSTENDTELIIFLTARIIHRAGDDDADVPGTQLGATP